MTAKNRQLPDFVQQHQSIKDIFGALDANVEWTNPKHSAATFFKSETYSDFILPSSLFLFGRRGTGKTSLLRMLDYETNFNNTTPYYHSAIIDSERNFHNLSIQFRDEVFEQLPRATFMYQVQQKWEWIIWVSAMVSINKTGHRSCDKITKYLDSEGLSDSSSSKNILQNLARKIEDSLNESDSPVTQTGRVLAQLIRKLFSPSFEEAKKELLNIINEIKKPLLVLVDSIEEYEIHDSVYEGITSALIQTAYEFYTKHRSSICVKVALPSEIYPRLKPFNKEKIENLNLFILWTHKDLLRFIAKRVSHTFDSNEMQNKLRDFDDYAKARIYLYSIIPDQVTCEQGIEFDTFAYILRHTQKKPRQVLQMMNVIHHTALEVNETFMSMDTSTINKGVHSHLDTIVAGSLEIYGQIFPHAAAIVERVAYEMPATFNYGELSEKLKETNSLRASAGLGKEDVLRLLLESGCLGILSEEVHSLPNGTELKEAYFEYQIKGILQHSNRSIFAIHPMMYQVSQIIVKTKEYIYPVPIEHEEAEIILNMKINLT